jgi:hypothetical protein
MMAFSLCRPYSPIEATSKQSGRANSTGAAVEQLAGVGGDRAPEVTDPVRKPGVRRRGRGRDLGQFVAEQEDRQALEPVDYRVGPQGGGDVVLPTESPNSE